MESEKFDIAKIYPKLYVASKEKPTIVEVPLMRVLAINGEGDPQGPRFKDSVAALYSMAYAIKFLPRKNINPEGYIDFNVTAIEVMWSMKNGAKLDSGQKDNILWEAFIVVPGFITQNIVNIARSQIPETQASERHAELHIASLQEKTSVQVLHTGLLKNEQKATDTLNAFLDKKGFKPALRLHSIYLSDPTRTKTGRLRTIIRQPITKD
jgi:hypothetical protein